jgi:hypothetical protein
VAVRRIRTDELLMLVTVQDELEVPLQFPEERRVFFGNQPIAGMMDRGNREVMRRQGGEVGFELETPGQPQPPHFISPSSARGPSRIEPGDADPDVGHFAHVRIDQPVAAGQQMVVAVRGQEVFVIVQPFEQLLPVAPSIPNHQFHFIKRVLLREPLGFEAGDRGAIDVMVAGDEKQIPSRHVRFESFSHRREEIFGLAELVRNRLAALVADVSEGSVACKED